MNRGGFNRGGYGGGFGGGFGGFGYDGFGYDNAYGYGDGVSADGGYADGGFGAGLAQGQPYGDGGYSQPGVQYGDDGQQGVRTGRSAAVAGDSCATPVKVCALYHQNYIGAPCSCRVPGGHSHGRVSP